jgi:hypothetical protein
VKLGLACVALASGCFSACSSPGQAPAGNAGDAGLAGIGASGTGAALAGSGGSSGSPSGGGSAGLSFSGGSAGGTPGGAAGGGAGGAAIIGPGAIPAIHFGLNDECAGRALPAKNGDASCRVVLTGVTGGCTSAGLTPSTAADLATVSSAAQMSSEDLRMPVCTVSQLSVHSGPACAADNRPGWCYVEGGCDASQKCAAALCVTPSFAAAKVAYQLPAWLVCD